MRVALECTCGAQSDGLIDLSLARRDTLIADRHIDFIAFLLVRPMFLQMRRRSISISKCLGQVYFLGRE